MLSLSGSFARSVPGEYSASEPRLVAAGRLRRVFLRVAPLRLRYQPVSGVGVDVSVHAAEVLGVPVCQ